MEVEVSDNTVSELVSRTSSLHDSADSPDRQIRDVRRRRGIRRRESVKLRTGRESIRRGTGRESSRRGTGRESSRRGTGRESDSRGRRRVTRQRRGRVNQGPLLSRTKVALTAAARDHQLKERIASMTKSEKDDILARICQKHPSMVFELIDGSLTEQQGYHPRPGGESPSWCLCNNCREMPTDEEKQCCKQIEENCFSRLPDFDLVVLDEVVLLVAQRYRQDVLATEEDDDYNRGKGILLIGSLFYGLLGTLVQAKDVLFQAVVYGELRINTQIGLASTVALFREDLGDHSNDM